MTFGPIRQDSNGLPERGSEMGAVFETSRGTSNLELPTSNLEP
jgi:hypothetical protein